MFVLCFQVIIINFVAEKIVLSHGTVGRLNLILGAWLYMKC